ncbi:hypothetical protein G6O67_001811 [Ophiocordyceps sinensis]|uniref:Uncharacterized protein n=1 Tax=Ophiocordyceps sinensis TaxID=72228 RepID=A0A8H4PSZ1_9HYPO|nr:hypothetical protein G6O67_001811 [Ophiocordyceps sinensis]
MRGVKAGHELTGKRDEKMRKSRYGCPDNQPAWASRSEGPRYKGLRYKGPPVGSKNNSLHRSHFRRTIFSKRSLPWLIQAPSPQGLRALFLGLRGHHDLSQLPEGC